MTTLKRLTTEPNIALISVVAAVAISVLAVGFTAELSYTCQVANVYALGDNGELSQSPWREKWEGSQFSVSRSSGEIIGELVTTEFAESTSVINAGSGANSFKALALFPPIGGSSAQVQIIEVQEFKEGQGKPFVVMSMGGAGIVTGQCR